jgi:hypothetical protein
MSEYAAWLGVVVLSLNSRQHSYPGLTSMQLRTLAKSGGPLTMFDIPCVPHWVRSWTRCESLPPPGGSGTTRRRAASQHREGARQRRRQYLTPAEKGQVWLEALIGEGSQHEIADT